MGWVCLRVFLRGRLERGRAAPAQLVTPALPYPTPVPALVQPPAPALAQTPAQAMTSAPMQRSSRLEDAPVARDESRCGGASSYECGRRRVYLTRSKVGGGGWGGLS